MDILSGSALPINVWPPLTRAGRVLRPGPNAVGTLAEQLALAATPRPRPTAAQRRAAAVARRIDDLERQLAALVRVVAEGRR